MPSNTRFVRSTFSLEPNTQVFESPINRASQRLELQGQRWRASFTLPPLNRAQAAPWIAFFLKMKGKVNSFSCSDPDWQKNLGPWTGTPSVAGAGQTGTTLNIDGATASVNGWGKAGDYFVAGSKLKRLTQDADSDGSGNVTLHFEPPFYTAPNDNSAITFNPATVSMRLVDDNVAEWSSNEQHIYESKAFQCVEDL